jgi:hypothetical protein
MNQAHMIKLFQLLVKEKNQQYSEVPQSLKTIVFRLRDRVRIKFLFLVLLLNRDLDNLTKQFLVKCKKDIRWSQSQIFQDFFALTAVGQQKKGYFVEFGATDGIIYNNTLYLERYHQWHGILAEPGISWKDKLKDNRTAHLDHRCVYSVSGKVIEFSENTDPLLSGVGEHLQGDLAENHSYELTTVSLEDLLLTHHAPKYIDYLSIDTEGSELLILKSFDFSKYRFGCITVEHNFNELDRSEIYTLLTENGYCRVLEQFSAHDDWYLCKSLKNL